MMVKFLKKVIAFCVGASLGINRCQCFSVKDPASIASTTTTTTPDLDSMSGNNKSNNILIMDHINFNHQVGRHDWLHAFYGDFLGFAWDPRKAKNVEKGSGTVWANIACNQIHLPEGKPDAQRLDGEIVFAYTSIERFSVHGERYKQAKEALSGSQFSVEQKIGKATNDIGGDEAVLVTDPWGSKIRLVKGDPVTDQDSRGRQPGGISEGLGMKELTIHVPEDANLEGIGRWYETVLGGCVVPSTTKRSNDIGNDELKGPHVCISMGPFQLLTFVPHAETTIDSHVDLRAVSHDDDKTGTDQFLANYGPHISLYVADLPSTYRRAADAGCVYVNTRFSRQAFSLEEALDQCMFRCLDIIDPLHPEDGIIIRIEHEVRSVVNPDGSMYKSCPFDEIPNPTASPSSQQA